MRKLAVRLCASVFLATVSLVTVAMAEQERAPLRFGSRSFC